MSLKVNKEVVERANIHFINIEELSYIYSKFIGEEWDLRIAPSSVSKLNRMNILSNNAVTPFGESIIAACVDEPIILKPKESRFEEFWMLYPRDDSSGLNSSTRMLRYNKQKTKQAYEEAIASGIPHETIIQCLNAEIGFRTQSKEGFKYMRNSVNYFKENSFLDYEDHEARGDDYGKEII